MIRRAKYRRVTCGFTLTELLVVVALFSVLAGMAIISVGRNRSAGDLDRFARAIANQVNVARQRAVETRSTYLLDLRAASVAYCQQDPANPAQATCPSPAGIESGALFQAGAEARILAWAGDVDIGQGLQRSFIGAGKTLYFSPAGSCDSDLASVVPNGITLYLEGIGDDQQHRMVAVLPLAARPRISNNW